MGATDPGDPPVDYPEPGSRFDGVIERAGASFPVIAVPRGGAVPLYDSDGETVLRVLRHPAVFDSRVPSPNDRLYSDQFTAKVKRMRARGLEPDLPPVTHRGGFLVCVTPGLKFCRGSDLDLTIDGIGPWLDEINEKLGYGGEGYCRVWIADLNQDGTQEIAMHYIKDEYIRRNTHFLYAYHVVGGSTPVLDLGIRRKREIRVDWSVSPPLITWSDAENSYKVEWQNGAFVVKET